jgi:dipeptide/tripeptide permease
MILSSELHSAHNNFESYIAIPRNLNPISIVVMIPIFDRVIYPFLHRRNINFSPIKRIYAGFLVAGLGKSQRIPCR